MFSLVSKREDDGTMKLRRTPFLAIPLVLLLTGCIQINLPESPPQQTSSNPPTVAPTESSTPTAEPVSLRIPETCGELVRLGVIQSQVSSHFVEIPVHLGPEGSPRANAFVSRGGIACQWGIPNSDAGMVVYVAPSKTPTVDGFSAVQVAGGLSECPPFLDACFYKDESAELGVDFTSAEILVEGFEIYIGIGTTDLNKLLNVAREAATNMGYV